MRPVLIELGPLKLYGYGAMIVLGGILSFWLLRRGRDFTGLRDDEDFWIIVNVILASGFVGGRILFVFEYARWFSPDFWRALFSASSGFSVLGAFIAVPLGLGLFCRARGVPFLRLFDAVCVMAPFWHVFGRLGCTLAGCCYGRPTDAAWGIVFRDARAMVPPEWRGIPLHPTQLYEAAGNAALAAALFFLLKRTRTRAPGLVAAAYFAAYGVERFILEYYRGDTVPLGWGLTAGQGLSLGMIGAACALMAGRAWCFRRS